MFDIFFNIYVVQAAEIIVEDKGPLHPAESMPWLLITRWRKAHHSPEIFRFLQQKN